MLYKLIMNVSTCSDYQNKNKGKISSKKFQRSSSQKLIRPYSANFNSSKISNQNISIPNSNESNKTFINVFNVSNISKTKLYEETLQLKTQINRIQKDIALAKTENLKIENLINQKVKAIENANNKINDYYDKLKDDNEISKLKDKFREMKSELVEKIEQNEKIKNEIKRINIGNLNLIQEQKFEKFKNVVNEYYRVSQINNENEKLIEEMIEKKDIFHMNHNKINNMKNKIEKSKSNIQLLNKEIRNLMEKINNNENKIKKEQLNIKNLKQLNERLLYEKKSREEYIQKKPILKKQINELENKLNEYKSKKVRNEQELNKINEQTEKLKKFPNKKEILSVKPLNYNLYVQIEKNPAEEESEKVRLLESLIKESKKRQNEYLDIISYYDDYAKQKKMYDKIKEDEQKEIDENNEINENNEIENDKIDENIEYINEKNNDEVNELNDNDNNQIQDQLKESNEDNGENNIKNYENIKDDNIKNDEKIINDENINEENIKKENIKKEENIKEDNIITDDNINEENIKNEKNIKEEKKIEENN